jgi:hypothetical protein
MADYPSLSESLIAPPPHHPAISSREAPAWSSSGYSSTFSWSLVPIRLLARNAVVFLEAYFLSLDKRSTLLVASFAAALILLRSGLGIIASLP